MFDPTSFLRPFESAFQSFYSPVASHPGLDGHHFLPNRIGIFNWQETGSSLPDWVPGVQDETVYMGGQGVGAPPEADHQRSFHFGPWSWDLGSSVEAMPQLASPADYHSNDEYEMEHYGAQPYYDGSDSLSYAQYLGQQNAHDRYIAQDANGMAAAHGYYQTANVIADPIGQPLGQPSSNPDYAYESGRQNVFPDQYSQSSSQPVETEHPAPLAPPSSPWSQEESPDLSHGLLA